MRSTKEFEYYTDRRIVNKISPDVSRAHFLIQESKILFQGLSERVKVMG